MRLLLGLVAAAVAALTWRHRRSILERLVDVTGLDYSDHLKPVVSDPYPPPEYADDYADDQVDMESAASFPASDPPGNW